jgi:hypothetical protein
MSKIKTRTPTANDPVTPVKRPTLEAFDTLVYELSKVKFQLSSIEDAVELSDGDCNRYLTGQIKALSTAFTKVIVASDVLRGLLEKKRPGGARPNQYRRMAFQILVDQYIKDDTVLKPKKLHEELLGALPKNVLLWDADGKEVFSLRIAREVCKDFRAALWIQPLDGN